ncbi:hypothetical protein Tco_0208983 [Tanacetum coccineum]
MAILSQLKDLETVQDDDQEPSAGTDRGSKRRRLGKEPASTSAPSETTTTTRKLCKSTDVFKGPADQEFETGVQDEQAEEEVQHLPDWFQTLTPELLAGLTFELMKGTCKSLTELEYFCEEVYKATTEKLD